MDNFEAAKQLMSLYAEYARKAITTNSKYEEAVALAIGALRKDSDRNASN